MPDDPASPSSGDSPASPGNPASVGNPASPGNPASVSNPASPANPTSPANPAPCSNPTSFVVEFDLAGLIAALGIDCGTAEDQEAVLAAEQAELAAASEPPAEVPGRVAVLLPTGTGLAAWLASATTGDCPDAELPDVALGYRRLAAWAQAQELSAVAEISSRTAKHRNRLDAAGKPCQVLPEAGAEVALALTMSQPAAMDWTGLATQLRWQLPATGVALSDGRIDLPRARIIAEATAPLPNESARAVEQRVLACAERQTTGQLRASVRRAVIAVDPDGAERRRERAERCAKVSLYPDHDGTASLVGSGLPVVTAAAAMARITAIARAMKADGFSGGLDYLRAYVMLGLLLGTLPPAAESPGTPGSPPGDAQPGNPRPGDPLAGNPRPGNPPADNPTTGNGGTDDDHADVREDDDVIEADGPPPSWPPVPAGLPGIANNQPLRKAAGVPPPGLLDVLLPWSALIGSPVAEPAVLGRIGPVTALQASQLLDLATRHPATQWRVILTDDDGHAQAVERLRARRGLAEQIRAGPPTAAVVGRMTITIPASVLPSDLRSGDSGLRESLLRAASRAAFRDQDRRAADAAAGRCAHLSATAAYRPATRLREFVTARDGTCTFPPCGQPAWRADLDHTIPWHLGGPTCACNLSARCRTHHKIKQLTGWGLSQPEPGTFRWTTPAGRAYVVGPNRYPV